MPVNSLMNIKFKVKTINTAFEYKKELKFVHIGENNIYQIYVTNRSNCRKT